jgi:hypothetical protein
MTAGDSNALPSRRPAIAPADRDLMRRLTIVLLFIGLFAAGFAYLDRVYSQKFLDITGRAQWIWAQHRLSSNEPVAFFAAREFDLPERRQFTHLKVLGDPEYSVWVNGRELARRSVGEERSLDLYDISESVRTGRNRIVIAVRSAQGVGGLIASLDIGAEAANWIVTDGSWRIHRRWSPELPLREPTGGRWEPPMIIGDPPIGRWNYLSVRKRALDLPSTKLVRPRRSFEQMGAIPMISTREGVAVAIAERQRATAFDFGVTTGRVRLTLDRDHFSSRAVNVRLANHLSELPRAEWTLRRVVFAPGERTVTLAEPATFRYVMAFAKGVSAEVVVAE